MKRFAILFFFLFATAAPAFSQNASPLGGVGSLQVFDNTGAILPGAVFYIYNAGTTVQATVYSDSTATTTLPNPVTLGSGARASIWLANGTFVKVVECQQNDGSVCAAGDQLFVADQIPIGSSSSSGNTGTFTGIFISSTASPATSGTLRLSSGDSTCWRNASGSANICWTKSSGDILQWGGGSLQLPEIAAPTCGAAGTDCFWADNTSHRFRTISNGGTAAQFVLSGNDIDVTDAVKDLHFGGTQIPTCSTAPTSNQYLQFSGTCLQGVTPPIIYNTASASTNASISAVTMTTSGGSGNTYRFSVYATQSVLGSGCSTNTTVQTKITYTDPYGGLTSGSSVLLSTIVNNGTLGNQGSATTTFRAAASTAVQYLVTYTQGTCTTGPSYQVFPILEQLQ